MLTFVKTVDVLLDPVLATLVHELAQSDFDSLSETLKISHFYQMEFDATTGTCIAWQECQPANMAQPSTFAGRKFSQNHSAKSVDCQSKINTNGDWAILADSTFTKDCITRHVAEHLAVVLVENLQLLTCDHLYDIANQACFDSKLPIDYLPLPELLRITKKEPS